MLDFQQKRKLRSRLYNRWFLGFLALIVILAIHSTWNVYQKQRESATLLGQSEEQETELQNRQNELQNKIADMQTPQGLEAEIRSKFNVARPDENVAIVLESDDSATSTSTTTVSFWQKIVKFFSF
jgi:cell division protein FtsB